MTISKPKVLIIDALNDTLPVYQKLEQNYTLSHYKPTTRPQFIQDLKDSLHDESHPLNSVSAVYGGWIGFNLIGEINTEILDLLKPADNPLLQIITVCSAGYHLYNLEDLRKHGVDFCNTPTFGADYVSETALYHILNGFRKFNIFEMITRQKGNTTTTRNYIENAIVVDGKFQHPDSNENGDETQYAFGHNFSQNEIIVSPQNKTAVLIGFGTIGKLICQKLLAFNMDIHYINTSGPLTAQQLEDAKLPNTLHHHASLDHALSSIKHIDLIVTSVPATPKTQGLLNASVFKKLSDAVIVNVGRGSVVVEDDILKALDQHHIRHYGLDVYPEEPKINEKLLTHMNVSLTPHLGSSTQENYDLTCEFCIENIIDKLTSGTAQNVQN